jgi:hypothetical protein
LLAVFLDQTPALPIVRIDYFFYQFHQSFRVLLLGGELAKLPQPLVLAFLVFLASSSPGDFGSKSGFVFQAGIP